MTETYTDTDKQKNLHKTAYSHILRFMYIDTSSSTLVYKYKHIHIYTLINSYAQTYKYINAYIYT